MHIIHRSATAQCWLGLEHSYRAQSDTMLRLSSFRTVKKKLPVKQILNFCFSSWTAFLLSYESHQIDPKAFKFRCHSEGISTTFTGLFVMHFSKHTVFLSIKSLF